MVYLIRSSDPANVVASLQEANNDAKQLRNSFQTPDGSRIRYDTHSPRDRWVIQQAGDPPIDRYFDRWPIMELTNNNANKNSEQ